ncbi:Transmembrane protein 271 [Camelus dromedarius]|uniref:Transmembrane protein 271 n=1 Tax=Camelus dromedarius TaxID=9838 RepID=A0A5N4EF03_CAMDR|nr:Transmembrane protein 271 [Camelus dromedarius]
MEALQAPLRGCLACGSSGTLKTAPSHHPHHRPVTFHKGRASSGLGSRLNSETPSRSVDCSCTRRPRPLSKGRRDAARWPVRRGWASQVSLVGLQGPRELCMTESPDCCPSLLQTQRGDRHTLRKTADYLLREQTIDLSTMIIVMVAGPLHLHLIPQRAFTSPAHPNLHSSRPFVTGHLLVTLCPWSPTRLSVGLPPRSGLRHLALFSFPDGEELEGKAGHEWPALSSQPGGGRQTLNTGRSAWAERQGGGVVKMGADREQEGVEGHVMGVKEVGVQGGGGRSLEYKEVREQGELGAQRGGVQGGGQVSGAGGWGREVVLSPRSHDYCWKASVRTTGSRNIQQKGQHTPRPCVRKRHSPVNEQGGWWGAGGGGLWRREEARLRINTKPLTCPHGPAPGLPRPPQRPSAGPANVSSLPPAKPDQSGCGGPGFGNGGVAASSRRWLQTSRSTERGGSADVLKSALPAKNTANLLLVAAIAVQDSPTQMDFTYIPGQMVSVKRGRGAPARGLPGEYARDLWRLVPLLTGTTGRCELWGGWQERGRVLKAPLHLPIPSSPALSLAASAPASPGSSAKLFNAAISRQGESSAPRPRSCSGRDGVHRTTGAGPAARPVGPQRLSRGIPPRSPFKRTMGAPKRPGESHLPRPTTSRLPLAHQESERGDSTPIAPSPALLASRESPDEINSLAPASGGTFLLIPRQGLFRLKPNDSSKVLPEVHLHRPPRLHRRVHSTRAPPPNPPLDPASRLRPSSPEHPGPLLPRAPFPFPYPYPRIQTSSPRGLSLPPSFFPSPPDSPLPLLPQHRAPFFFHFLHPKLTSSSFLTSGRRVGKERDPSPVTGSANRGTRGGRSWGWGRGEIRGESQGAAGGADRGRKAERHGEGGPFLREAAEGVLGAAGVVGRRRAGSCRARRAGRGAPRLGGGARALRSSAPHRFLRGCGGGEMPRRRRPPTPREDEEEAGEARRRGGGGGRRRARGVRAGSGAEDEVERRGACAALSSCLLLACALSAAAVGLKCFSLGSELRGEPFRLGAAAGAFYSGLLLAAASRCLAPPCSAAGPGRASRGAGPGPGLGFPRPQQGLQRPRRASRVRTRAFGAGEQPEPAPPRRLVFMLGVLSAFAGAVIDGDTVSLVERKYSLTTACPPRAPAAATARPRAPRPPVPGPAPGASRVRSTLDAPPSVSFSCRSCCSELHIFASRAMPPSLSPPLWSLVFSPSAPPVPPFRLFPFLRIAFHSVPVRIVTFRPPPQRLRGFERSSPTLSPISTWASFHAVLSEGTVCGCQVRVPRTPPHASSNPTRRPWRAEPGQLSSPGRWVSLGFSLKSPCRGSCRNGVNSSGDSRLASNAGEGAMGVESPRSDLGGLRGTLGGREEGMAFSLASLGAPIVLLKGDLGGMPLESPLRSHRAERLGLRRWFYAHRRGADDSPCRLIAALNNFALDPGEAGAEAARESAGGGGDGKVKGCFENTPPFLPPAWPVLACGDTPRAHSQGYEPPKVPRVWRKLRPHSPGSPRAGAPRPRFTETICPGNVCEVPSCGSLDICVGLSRFAVFLAGSADFRTSAEPPRSVLLLMHDDLPEKSEYNSSIPKARPSAARLIRLCRRKRPGQTWGRAVLGGALKPLH